jgi:hypothetical protein
MNEGGAARRQLRSYVFGAACLAAVVSLAACSGGTSIGGNPGAACQRRRPELSRAAWRVR